MPCVAQEAQVPAEATVVLALTADASKPLPKKRTAPPLRLLTPSQVLSKQLAQARTLERATATQRRQQAKTWAAKTPKGSVNKWQPSRGKKPVAKAMPPTYAAPKPPAGRPKPPPPPQEKVLWHVDLRETAEQNTVLRQALFQLKSRQQPKFLIVSSLVQLVMRPAVGATVGLITSWTQDHTIRNWAVWDPSVEKVPAGGRQQRQL